MKPLQKLRRYYHLFQAYQCNSPLYENPNIKLHNWCTPVQQDFWIPKFMEYKKLAIDKKIGVFSVFGLRTMIKLSRNDIKIFIARENVHRSNWSEYDDVCLGEKCLDLIIGFDYNIKDERYIRFPLWIMWLFPPNIDYSGIKAFCDRINNPNNSSYDSREFCSFITSHNDIGREELFNEINSINKIDSAGRFLHNCDDLKSIYNDDKLKFLQHYRFNLCPENSNCEGYCTEKIFEAISSGCIPIYWGSNNNPEPNILNQNVICFVNVGKRNDETVIKHIRDLNANKNIYEEFAKQPRLLPDAADRIMQYIIDLENKLKQITKNY